MQDFNKLKVWQSARQLTRAVYELTASFPRSEEFGLKAQMRRAVISICSNIAEGRGRRGDREFRRYLDIAMGSVCELECELLLSVDLALVPKRTVEPVGAALTEVRRMLSGLMSSLIVPDGLETNTRGKRRPEA